MSYICYNDAIGIRGEEPENEVEHKGSKVKGSSGSKSHDIVDRSHVEGSVKQGAGSGRWRFKWGAGSGGGGAGAGNGQAACVRW